MNQKQKVKLVEKIATWFMLLILITQVITSSLFGVVAHAESSVGDLLLIDEQGVPVTNMTLEKGEVKVIGVKTTNKEDTSVQVNLNGLHLNQEQTNERNTGNPVSIAYSEEASNVIVSWQTKASVESKETSADEQSTADSEPSESLPVLEDPVTQFVDNQAWLVIEATEAGSYHVQASSSRTTGVGVSEPLVVTVSELKENEAEVINKSSESQNERDVGKSNDNLKKQIIGDEAIFASTNTTFEIWNETTQTWSTQAEEITDSSQYSKGLKYRITWENDTLDRTTFVLGSDWGEVSKADTTVKDQNDVAQLNTTNIKQIVIQPSKVGTIYTIETKVNFKSSATDTAFESSFQAAGDGQSNLFKQPLEIKVGANSIYQSSIDTRAVFPNPVPIAFYDTTEGSASHLKGKDIKFTVTSGSGVVQNYSLLDDGDENGVVFLNLGKLGEVYTIRVTEAFGFLTSDDETSNYNFTVGSIGNWYNPDGTAPLITSFGLKKIVPQVKTDIHYQDSQGNIVKKAHFNDIITSHQTIIYTEGSQPEKFNFSSNSTSKNMELVGDVSIYKLVDGKKEALVKKEASEIWTGNSKTGYTLSYNYQLDSPLLTGEQVVMETTWKVLEPSIGAGNRIGNYDIGVSVVGVDNKGVPSNSVIAQSQLQAFPYAATASKITKEVFRNGISIPNEVVHVGENLTYRITFEVTGGEETAQLRVTHFEDILPEGLTVDKLDLSAVKIFTSKDGEFNLWSDYHYHIDDKGHLTVDFADPDDPLFEPDNILYISSQNVDARKLIIEIKTTVDKIASGGLVNNATITSQTRTNDFDTESWGAPNKQSDSVSNTVAPEVQLKKHVYAEDPSITMNQEDAQVLYTDKSFFYSIDANLTPESGAMHNGMIEDAIPDELIIQNKYSLIINNTPVDLPEGAVEVNGQKVKLNFSKIPELSPMTNNQKVQFIIEVKADSTKVKIGENIPNTATITGTDKQENNKTDASSTVGVHFVYPPGELSIEKSVGKMANNQFEQLENKSPVKVGDTVTYKLIVKNTAAVGTIVRAVHAKDDVPKGLEIDQNSIKVKIFKENEERESQGTNLGTGQNLDVLIGDLMGGEWAEVTFNVVVTKNASGELKNIASASGKIDEVPNGPDIDKEAEQKPSTELGITPNPELSKTVSQKKAYKGQILTYTIVAKNENGAPIINGKISDRLPDEVKYVRDTTVVNGVKMDDTLFGWVTDVNNKDSFEYSGLTIDAEKTITITFDVEVITNEIKTDITNTAKLNGDYQVNKDTTETIEEKTASDDFETVRNAGKLSIKKEVSEVLEGSKDSVDKHDKVVKVGDIIEYKLIVENTVKEPSIIYNVKVTDTIPKGLIYQDNTLKVNGEVPTNGSKVEGNSLLVIIGEVTEKTEPIVITFDVKVTETALAITKNKAMALGETLEDPTNPDSNKIPQTPTSNEVLVHKQPDPIIKKEVIDPTNGNVFNGDEILYQISIANGTKENKALNGDLLNAKVTDDLDPNLEYVADSTTVGGTKISDTGVWTKGRNFSYTFNEAIPAGETRIITFKVRVSEDAKGKINNTATVIGEDKDKNELPKKDDTVDVTVYPKPGNLEIKKSVLNSNKKEIPNGVVAEDSIITYQLVIKNTVPGNSEVLNASIEDKIPAGLIYQKDTLRVVDKPDSVNVKELSISKAPETVKAVLDKLTGGQEVRIEFQAQVTKTAEAIIDNKGIANGQIVQTPGGEPSALDPVADKVTVYKAPDPQITKKVIEPVSKDVIKGSRVTYELVITNGDANTGELLNGKVKDELPDGLIYIPGTTKINGQPATPAQEASWSADKKTFDYDLPSPYLGGTKTTITFTVEVTKGDKLEEIGKPIPNNAFLTGEDKDKTSYTPEKGTDTITPVLKDGKLEIEKSVFKDTENMHNKVVSVNDIIEYQLVVKNTEELPSEVKNVVVTDNIPTGLEYQEGTLEFVGENISATGQVVDNILTAELNTLTQGQVVTIKFKVKVTEKAKGTIENVASAKGKVTPVDGESPIDITDNADEHINKAPAPKIEKSIVTPTKPIVTKGDQITYRLVVTNGDENTGVLKNGIVTDALVPGLKHVPNTTTMDGQPVEESSWTEETLTVHLPTVIKGGAEAITIEFKVVVDSNELGTVPNTAYVSGQDITESGSYTDEGNANIEVVPKAGELNLKKSVSKGNEDVHDKIIHVGDIVTYTIVVENPVTDPSEVRDIILKDTIPEGLVYQVGTLKVNGTQKSDSHVTDQNVTINLGLLKEKEQVVVTFDVKVTEVAKGKITNIASVSGTVTPPGQPEETLPEIEDTVENSKIPDPKIQKTVVDDGNNPIDQLKVIKGQEVTYQLVVTNGTETTGILYDGVVTDTLDSGLEYVSGSTTINGEKVTDEIAGWTGNQLTHKLPKEFAGGNKYIITFKVKVTRSELGLIANTGYVTGKDSEKSPTIDYDHSNKVDIEVIRGTADPSISKEVRSEDGIDDLNDTTVKAETTIQYNLIVENKNQEPSEIRNTIVTDTIPVGLTYIPGSLTLDNVSVGDEHVVGQQLTLDVGTLIEGQKKIISFKVVVTDEAKGISQNIAYVSGKTTDTTGSDKELSNIPSNPVTIHKPAAPDIKKSIVGKTEVTLGSDIVYKLEVSNGTQENGELLEGVVSDELPVGLTYKAGTTKVDQNPVSDKDIWKENKLSYRLSPNYKGGSVTIIEFVATVKELGTINNTATVSGTDFSKSSYNEVGTATVTVTAKPDPSIEKSVKRLDDQDFVTSPNETEVKVNDHLVYRLIVKNGTADAGTLFDPKVEDQLPKGLVYVPNSTTINGTTRLLDADHWKDNTFTYTRPSMAPGEVWTIEFEVKVIEATDKQQIKNSATLTGTDIGTMTYNDQSEVSVIAKVDPSVDPPIEENKDGLIDDPIKEANDPTIGQKLPNTSSKTKNTKRYPNTGELNEQLSWLGYVLVINLLIYYLFRRKEQDQLL
ncbi:isopeptide-forming domain-containing fimbrial protein [Candidatus Enterococcus mansonii]|uniref:isopeptide-forming domain-containing fimbrial protein n=1 Tax=Candidatus Enterococcus mansonii TaxID=1834181 RepID=UPI0015C4EBC6|nr:isopeptide-forming domain-containing fimbrial protein [Enterococcus sp. 4G2_DIV0659]